MKLLTITVPCYNSQDYMEKCIESLLPGGDRVEIIVIDDGSTDRTGAIADSYAEKYPDIVRVIHQENGGHGEGINQGLRHATGAYFKVVDSDDALSTDYLPFLDTLEKLHAQGGMDLFLTNYYYVHTDGVGDRSINYKCSLPQNRLFSWEETKPFRVHQLMTIHSCTFRTELMRNWAEQLPKHVFYEDNLMVYQTLPHVQKLYYSPVDLYRYWIGRPDQSVQKAVMLKRYHHQLLVTERCFTACHLDDIASKRLHRYLRHELFTMFAIGILYARLNKTDEADARLQQMWDTCYAFDPKWAKHFRNCPLWFLCIPGGFGRWFCGVIYWLANKVVRFN